jgi:hypothetical protein
MRRTRRLAAVASAALALLALGAVAVAQRPSQPRHRAQLIGRSLGLPKVRARPTPVDPLMAFPTTTCPGFGVPPGWRVVWSDLQRGGDLHSEARPPGSQVSIACDRGPAAGVHRLPTAPPGMRALFRRVVAAQRSAVTLQRSRSRVLHWRPVKGAVYYNVQVFDGRRRLVLAWPRQPRLRVPARLLRAGRSYDWYAWPAYGSYAHPRFGPALASARLVGAP